MVAPITPDVVADQREWVRENEAVPSLINRIREDFSEAFDTDVDQVSKAQYQRTVDQVFADGDLAVNVAALVAILRELDVEDDYPGFVVDEMLGRELAGMVAGNQPLGMLGEAAFHYTDVLYQPDEGIDEPRNAGVDDLEAALAAGLQTRIPGWNWRETESPFGVER